MRVRCPVRRIGRAQPPSVAICRARGARCPVAASFASRAVNLARRSRSERPADAEAVTPAGPVAVGNADVGHGRAGVVVQFGSWSCAGMREWPFGGRRTMGRGPRGVRRQAGVIGSHGTGRLVVGRGGRGRWGLVGEGAVVITGGCVTLTSVHGRKVLPPHSFLWVVERG